MQEPREQRRPCHGQNDHKGFLEEAAFSLVCLLFLQRVLTEHLLADVAPGAGGAAVSYSLSSWSSIAREEIEHQVLNFRGC